MKTHWKVLVLCLGVLAIIAAGCKTSQPGVTKTWNRLETLVEAQPQQVVDAATQTLTELDMKVLSSNSSKLAGEVIARTPDDKKITVSVTPRPNGLTELKVYTGYWGDSDMSQRIIENIKSKLYSEPTGTSTTEEKKM
jgi:hypothetical protein